MSQYLSFYRPYQKKLHCSPRKKGLFMQCFLVYSEAILTRFPSVSEWMLYTKLMSLNRPFIWCTWHVRRPAAFARNWPSKITNFQVHFLTFPEKKNPNFFLSKTFFDFLLVVPNNDFGCIMCRNRRNKLQNMDDKTQKNNENCRNVSLGAHCAVQAPWV